MIKSDPKSIQFNKITARANVKIYTLLLTCISRKSCGRRSNDWINVWLSLDKARSAVNWLPRQLTMDTHLPNHTWPIQISHCIKAPRLTSYNQKCHSQMPYCSLISGFKSRLSESELTLTISGAEGYLIYCLCKLLKLEKAVGDTAVFQNYVLTFEAGVEKTRQLRNGLD